MTHLLPPHAVALVYLVLFAAIGQPLQVTCHRHGDHTDTQNGFQMRAYAFGSRSALPS